MGEATRRRRYELEKQKAIEAAKTPTGMAAERELYARKWSEVDATNFKAGGHYKWMASRVSEYHRILEIGTGDGSGTIELLRNGHAVVSIDENPACLRIAQCNISSAGYSVELVIRGQVLPADDAYGIQYEPLTQAQPKDGVLLVEGDTLTDQYLLSWLDSQPPFDAVVCWLLGSHRARQLNVAIPMESAYEYRIRVQNHLYEISEMILRPGGVLNTIDRGDVTMEMNGQEILRADIVSSHAAQALPTSLVVDSQVDIRPYSPPSAEGVAMGVTLGTSGVTLPGSVIGLISVIARKPRN